MSANVSSGCIVTEWNSVGFTPQVRLNYENFLKKQESLAVPPIPPTPSTHTAASPHIHCVYILHPLHLHIHVHHSIFACIQAACACVSHCLAPHSIGPEGPTAGTRWQLLQGGAAADTVPLPRGAVQLLCYIGQPHPALWVAASLTPLYMAHSSLAWTDIALTSPAQVLVHCCLLCKVASALHGHEKGWTIAKQWCFIGL